MGMNARLLRPRATGYVAPDADARAYIASVEIADGQKLEKAVAVAINDFVAGCKTDGIWSAIKAACILMGARTLSGALTPLVGSAPTNNNFVSGDYNRETGLVGNASTKYLNANRANDTDAQNNQHLAGYVGEVIGSSGNLFAVLGTGSSSIAGSSFVSFRPSDGLISYESRSSAVWVDNGAVTSPRFVGVSRSGSANFVVRYGASSFTRTQASATPTAGDIFVFARNQSGTGAAFSSQRLSFYSIGESLDLGLLRGRVDSLVSAIGAAI